MKKKKIVFDFLKSKKLRNAENAKKEFIRIRGFLERFLNFKKKNQKKFLLKSFEMKSDIH